MLPASDDIHARHLSGLTHMKVLSAVTELKAS